MGQQPGGGLVSPGLKGLELNLWLGHVRGEVRERPQALAEPTAGALSAPPPRSPHPTHSRCIPRPFHYLGHQQGLAGWWAGGLTWMRSQASA